MVPRAGLEPAQEFPLPPQDSVSTNSTTSARKEVYAKQRRLASFFCDSVKFFRLSAWGPGLFPCAGVTDGSSGEEPHSLLWKGRRNLFVSVAEGSFLGAAEPSAWGSRFDPHVRGGWAAAERRAFPSICRRGLPCRAVACQCRGNRLNKDGGHERLV